MTKRKALGSGLEALLSTKQPAAGSQDLKEDYLASSSSKISSIPIHEISRNKDQPRQVFFNDALESIASSIKEIGQKVPILVRKKDDGYELIAGERRWRAMQSIQAENIDAIVMDVTDKESALIAIVENVQREQLNPVEEAEALLKLNTEYGMTHDDIAKYTGKSRSHITNIMRLNVLTEYTKSQLIEGNIEMGHARAVLSLGQTIQNAIIKDAVAKKLSVRTVELMVRNKKPSKIKGSPSKSQDTISLENELSEYFSADVKIYHKPNGSGNIQVKYKSLDELEGITDKLKK